MVITPIDVDNAVLFFDFSSYAGTQNVVISIGGCFRNVPVVELGTFGNFQDFTFLGNKVGTELPNFFVLVDAVDDKGNMQWLDFEPAAHVIYILNLINRINNPDTLSVLDISKQEEAFVAVYNAIYVDGGSEHYKRLIRNVEKSNGQGYERKRLKDCYKIIANCVNVQCSFFNESPSPYVVSLERPLTIDPSLIEISDKFKNLNSIKWLFAKK